jgi:hypothetical protein
MDVNTGFPAAPVTRPHAKPHGHGIFASHGEPPKRLAGADLCSARVSEPMRSRPKGYDFPPSCIRHGFGYRNYKKQNRFTETARTSIDAKFKADTYAVCSQYKGWHAAQGVECRRIADACHGAVRACGGAVPASVCPD